MQQQARGVAIQAVHEASGMFSEILSPLLMHLQRSIGLIMPNHLNGTLIELSATMLRGYFLAGLLKR